DDYFNVWSNLSSKHLNYSLILTDTGLHAWYDIKELQSATEIKALRKSSLITLNSASIPRSNQINRFIQYTTSYDTCLICEKKTSFFYYSSSSSRLSVYHEQMNFAANN
ncbi:hypothetical protein ACJX0J_035319, partial [Zea mays]